MARVYVSSTYTDLRDYRAKVRDDLIQQGHEGVAMEYYVAEDRPPVKKCLEDVAACDLYVGIFAWRYGWVPEEDNPEGWSITEMEYREARRCNKTCFIFFLDGQMPWPPDYIDDDKTKIKRLRAELSERHGGQPFTSPDHLASQVKGAIYRWALAQSPIRTEAPRAAFDFKRYFAELLKRYQRLDLEALTPAKNDEYLQIQLRSVFVEQGVRDNPPPLEYPKEVLDRLKRDAEIHPEDFPDEVPLEEVRRASEVYYEMPPRPVISVLTDPGRQHVIILGDPGSGKSTLARYLLLSVIDPSGDERIREAFAGFLPLLIELRSYVAVCEKYKEYKNFLDFLNHLGETEGFYPDKGTLHDYLSGNGRAVVIFDGLDEIFDAESREQVARQVAGFAAQYPKVSIVVTSRVIGYRRKILSDAGFAHFTLQDLDEQQVDEFIRRWYVLALRDRHAEAQDRHERIMQAYQDSFSIRQLSGNPMLLTIMAIIGKNQELPRDRSKLYHHAAGVLIEHWGINKYLKDQRVDAAFIDEDDKREMLRQLAYKMQGGEGGLAGNYIHREQLQTEFEDYLKARYNTAPERAKVIAQAVMRHFRERNFILSLYGANLYGFVHRAFLEYFCASAFIFKFEKTKELSTEQLMREVFGQRWDDQSWHEVLRLIAGEIAAGFTGEIIRYLSEEVYTVWPEQKGLGRRPPWNIALAVKCLSEVRNLNLVAGPAELLLRRTCQMFDYDMTAEPRLFSFFKGQVVPYAEGIGRAWPRGEVLAEILRGRRPADYAYIYDRQFGTFIGSIGAGRAEVKAAVLEYARGADPRHRVLAPFALATGWRDDPETLPLLRELAVNDAHETVRYAATYAIAENYRTEPQTLSLLRAQAVGNDTTFARTAAISGLARHFNDDPETFKLIRELLTKEQHKYPRTALVKALGEFFHDEPETYTLLLGVAGSDNAPGPTDRPYPEPYYAREAAIDAVYRFWPTHPDTHRLLLDRTEHDQTPWLREVAAEMLRKLSLRKATA
jgi:energy-coupling factor transporter ATP-binding protein EcfA2